MRFLSPLLIICFIAFFAQIGIAQCPQFTSSSASITGDVCPGDMVTFTTTGTDLPNNGSVEWYIGAPPFNPAFGQGTFIGSSDITGSSTTPTPCSPCPEITAALIDACVSGSGNEADNEFIVVSSGGGFNISDFYVDIPIGNNTVPANNGDFNIGGFCTWQIPDPVLMASLNAGGCSGSFIAVNPGESIPPASTVMIFPSAGQTFTFDFTTFCASGQTAYVIQNGCDRTIGALTNGSSSGTRTYTVGLSCCSTSWTYDLGLADNNDGAFVYVDDFGNNVYNNTGCNNPTIEAIPSDPQPEPTIDPFPYTFDDTYCNTTQNIVGYIQGQGPGCNPLTNYFEYNIICPEFALPASIDVCDDGTGTFSFNLNSLNTQVNGGTASPVYYFENSNLTGQISNTIAYNTGTTVIYAQVGTTSSFCGINTAEISLNVNPGPTANPVTITQCDDAGSTVNFDLFNIATQVNGFAGNTVNFYMNANATGPIATVSNYNSGTTTIYAQVTNNGSNCQSDIVPINLNVEPAADPALVSFALAPDTGCGPTNVQVTVTLPPGLYDVFIQVNDSSPSVSPFFGVTNGQILNFPSITETTTFVLAGIENTSTNCLSTYDIPLTVTISTGANANAASLSDCDDGSGSSFFDLNDAALVINGGSGEPVNFYSDATGIFPISAVDATNYEVTGTTTVYASVGTAPCESSLVELDLNVNTGGTVMIGSDETICLGESANLTVTFTNGTPPYNFELLTNGGSPQAFNSINSSPYVVPVSPITNTIYTIANAMGNGCAMTEIGSAEITVEPVPTVSLSPTQSICQGESGEIVFTFTGTPPFTFTYDENGVNPTTLTQNDLSYTINPTPTINTTYTVTALSDANCDGVVPVSTEITVSSTETAVNASLSTCGDATNSAVFDLNDAASQINSSSGSPINFYSDAGAMSPISATDAMNFSVTGSVTVYATIVTGTCESNIVELDLTVNAQGIAIISADEEICSGESVNLVVNFSTGAPPYSFTLQANSTTVQTFDNIATSLFNIPAQTVLVPTIFTIINAEADGCSMAEAGDANITITPAPTANISGDQDICAGEDATLVFNFVGTPPFDFTYLEDGVNPQMETSNSLVFTLNVSPASSTIYTISEVSDDNCEGTVSGSATINVTPAPTAEISTNGTICEGDSYNLTIDFTGEAPFSFIYTIDGTPQAELTTNDNPYNFTVNPTAPSTDYGLSSVFTGVCAGTISPNVATVTVSDAPTVALISTTCNADNLTYNVIFEITGGTPPYTVSGDGGDLDATGTIFTSDNIASQTIYNFSIDDFLNCGPVTLSGTQDCSCSNSAGTMDFPTNLTELCESEQFTFTHNGDEIVDPGDVFGYIIHNNPNPELSFPFQWNPTSATFELTGSLVLNTIYYVSAVTGNPSDIPTEPFDVNDPCLSVSAGVPVIWRPNPTATISADMEVCDGDDATLTFDFTGVPPFTYTYNINGAVPSITQQTNDNQIVTTIPISENTTVTLESIEDNICQQDVNQAVTIEFNQNVSAVVTDTICTADISSYQIVIQVTGEEAFNVVSSAAGGGFVGNTYTSGMITSGDPYVFEITDANNCNVVTLSGDYTCTFACTGQLGEMSTVGLSLCVGEEATAIYNDTNESIEAGDVVQYVIHDNANATLGTPILIQNTSTFVWDAGLYLPNTTYYISVISGNDDSAGNVDLSDPCLLINAGQPVIWNQGSATITSTDQSICNGECTDITIQVEGIPNYEVIITDDAGGSETITDLNTEITYTVCPDVETTYTLDAVTSNGCAGLLNDPTSVTISPLTQFVFENFMYNCTPDNSQYSATFDLSGGTPPYTLVSGGGLLVGSSYTSDNFANNTAVTIEFTDDLGCELSVTLQNDCDCMNAPATVNTDLQELCLGEFSEIIILSDPIWGPGDVSAFILHNGTATELGTTTYAVTNDIFNQEPGGYTPGDTLFYTPVVSEGNGMGLPDLTDNCLNIGIGFPVVWYPPSDLTPPANISTCTSDCQDFTYTFSQLGEHTLEVTINGNPEIFTSVNDEIVITICPADYGVENGGIVAIAPQTLQNFVGCVTNFNNSPVSQLVISAPDMAEFNTQICLSDSVVVGTVTFDFENPTGEVTLENEAGCDSIVTVDLDFYDAPEGDFIATLCTGGSVQVGDVIFDEMNTSGVVNLPDASYLGCDSLVNVQISFGDDVSFQLDTTICSGNSVIINGETYDTDNLTGSFNFENGSYLGCDSIVNVSLSFYPESEFNDFQTLCTGGTYTVGTTVFDVDNQMGTVVLENEAIGGCDSTVNVVLTFNDVVNSTVDTVLCTGNTLTINGTVYGADNLTGIETFEDGSYLGCDSVVTVNVNIAQPAIQLIENEFCAGEEFDLEGTIYNEANPIGTQILSIPAANGCDSIAEVNLTFLPNSFGVLDTILCAGDIAIIGGVTLDEDNPTATFLFDGMSANGCDSTLTVNATFAPISESFIEVILQNDEVFVLEGETFDANNPIGQVILENQNYLGCDSIVNVNVLLFLDIQGEGNAPDCFGDSNGEIVLDTILFGAPPYNLTVDGTDFGTFSIFPYTINGLSAGEYELVVTDADGNVGDIKLLVPEAVELTLTLGRDTTINQGDSYLINGLTNMVDIADLVWTPTDSLDNDSTLTVTTSTLETISYSLFLQDSLGCFISDDITIYVNEDRQVFIPNVFSPNNDGQNDKFTIFGSDQIVQIKSLQIYDRWGEMVFRNLDFSPNDETLGWDGRHNDVLMNNQVLIYAAEIEFIDGEIEIFKGDVTILR